MPNLANIDNPTEDQEQEAFVQWLRLKGYPHFRVPNETYTKSWSQKAKNKKLGVSSGVPDLFVAVPFPPPHLSSPIKTVTMRFGTKPSSPSK